MRRGGFTCNAGSGGSGGGGAAGRGGGRGKRVCVGSIDVDVMVLTHVRFGEPHDGGVCRNMNGLLA